MRALALVTLSTLALAGCGFGLTATPDGILEEDGTAASEVPDPQEEESGEDGGAGPSAEGELPATAVDLEGKLYAIDPASMQVVEPPGLDALLHEVLERDVLVYVERETETSLQLAVALAGADGRQDRCERVREFPAGDWTENPVFDVGPGELEASFGGQPATFRSLELSGVFDEYGFAWTEGTLSAELDTRELAAALGDIDACALVADLGGECEPCDDGEDVCFSIAMEGITAEMVDGTFDTSPDRGGCR